MWEIIIYISLAILVIIGLATLWFYGKKKVVKQILLTLVIEAEKAWGSKTGKIKFLQVISAIYEKFPWLTYFTTTEQIIVWIEEAVKYIKTELLSDGTTIENSLSK